MTTRDSTLEVLTVLVVLIAGCAQKTATTEPGASPPPTASAPPPPAEPPATQEQRPPGGRIGTFGQDARAQCPQLVRHLAESPGAPTPRAVAANPPSTSPTASAPAPPPRVDEFTDELALGDVFFEPGRANIGRNGARTMRNNARWLVENPEYLVLIEGHTNYKGSPEANLAMGERRPRQPQIFSSRRAWPIRACGPSATAPTAGYAPRRQMSVRQRTGTCISA